MGTADANAEDETAGIIPRACTDLFASLQTKCEPGAKVTLSYLELYNEQIRDLFADNDSNAASTKRGLKLREANGSVQVQGCVEKVVTSPAEIATFMATTPSKQRRQGLLHFLMC